MITGTWLRPLCTEIVKPTKSGRIIERRDQVLIGLRLLAAIAASTLANKCASTNGPFSENEALSDSFTCYLTRRSRIIILVVRLLVRVLYPLAF